MADDNRTPAPMAHKIGTTVCEHGTLWIGLYNEDGEVFACAAVPVAVVPNFLNDITTAMSQWMAGQTMPACSGHA